MLFSTRTLRSIIGGKSPVDLPELALKTKKQAEAFLMAYGVDLENNEDRDLLEQTRQNALALLDTHILRGDEKIPQAVRQQRDISVLLLWASHEGPDLPVDHNLRKRQQAWSCALLRVGHTLMHAQNELNDNFARTIRNQIKSRFSAHIQAINGQLQLGSGEDAVPLIAFSIRPKKTLEAATMKLLRAIENVATDIFDWVGVRLVTKDPIDALLAVRYLRAHHVISFPNIIPGRSRNTLVDLDSIEEELTKIETTYDSLGEKIRKVRELASENLTAARADHRIHNNHSSPHYRSIQFTARELVRLPLGPGKQIARFFFPFEVQILDEVSFKNASTGPASHTEYRMRQLESVRSRVLAGILAAH